MSEKPLKIVPAPEAKVAPAASAETAASAAVPRGGRKRLRMILLVVIPLIAALAGGGVYLMGGRYISTDNAYVGAQKVLITPDVSGKVIHVAIKEGQHVNAGDELFKLDPEPYRLALAQAKAKLASARVDYDKLKTNLKSLDTLAELAKKNVELKRRDLERKRKLFSSQAGSQADVDTSGVQHADRGIAGALHRPATRQHARPAARQSRPAARRISRIRAGQGRGSTTRSAISTSPSCARRFPAPQRKSTISSSAGSLPPARRS